MAKTMASDDKKAPLLGSWRAWYILLLVVLALTIGALYWFTKYFA